MRLLVFSALFSPLAFIVFIAPETIAHRAIPSYFWENIPFAYLGAILPAWLSAAMDRALSTKPTYLRMIGTAVTAALITDAVALFFWGSVDDYRPVLMAGLVGAIPAAVCSWLSSSRQGQVLRAVGDDCGDARRKTC